MDEILKKLNKQAKEISLTKDEKSAVRNILVSYSKKSPYSVFSGFSFLIRRRVLVSAFAIILLLIGGGTSYAAQRALPGDILYPVKIGINEKIAGLTTLTKKAKAEQDVKILKRRLEEADKLTAKGKLGKKAETQMAKELKKALNKFNEHKNKKADMPRNGGKTSKEMKPERF